jgi:hypothetical protein
MHLLTLEFKRIVEMVKGMVASARERERENERMELVVVGF